MKKAVIFDIDGTLAQKSESRTYREYSKVALDIPISGVINVLRLYAASGYAIVLLTGRKEYSRQDTVDWLEKHISTSDVKFSVEHLFMRPDKLHTKAEVLKQDIFTKQIKPFFDIDTAYEDDLNVRAMWRKLGIATPDLACALS